MRLHILAIGARMPSWIAEGFTEYAQRMPRELSLHLQALAAPARSRSLDRSSLRRREAE